MDGRNCTGRRISLLNDSSDLAPISVKNRLPPLRQYSHSRDSSSCCSTPSLSPQTPQLSRSNSSDSRNLASPSPLTPTLNNFDSQYHSLSQYPQRQQYFLHSHSSSKMDGQGAPLYPPIPEANDVIASAYGLQPQISQHQQIVPLPAGQQAYRSSNSPQSEPSRVSTVSATSNSKAQTKKNSYPCPLAKQIGCTDFFTTSGHAARHAKKHTGKKDAFCPECNKAFTRKDNMEQHRRTHQNRSSARSVNGDDAKVKKPKSSSAKKASSVKAEPQQLEAALEQQLVEQQLVEQQLAEQQLADVALIDQQILEQPNGLPAMPVSIAPQITLPPAIQQQVLEQALMMQPGGTPYFMSATDPGPIAALPNVMPDLNIRPPLHRANFTANLDYVPPMASLGDPDSLHYSYPSPGLSNGLNSLALAACEHRRLSEEKSQSRSPKDESASPQESPSQEAPSEQT